MKELEAKMGELKKSQEQIQQKFFASFAKEQETSYANGQLQVRQGVGGALMMDGELVQHAGEAPLRGRGLGWAPSASVSRGAVRGGGWR